MSRKSLAAGLSVGLVLYLGWLGWKDLLTAPADRGLDLDAAAADVAQSAAAGVTHSSAEAPDAILAPAEGTWGAARSRNASSVTTAEHGALGASSPRDPASGPGGSDRSIQIQPAEGRRNEPEAPAAPEPRHAEDEGDQKDKEKDKRPRASLGGSVLDRDGEAAAGVPIEARPRRLFASLDEGGASAAVIERRSVTDAAGRFTFPDLPDGDYELRTEPTELYEKTSAVVRAGVDSVVLVVDARSRRTVYVHGVVESARGGPVGGVRVEVVGRPRLAAVTDDRGAYGLPVPAAAPSEQAALRFARAGYRDLRQPVDPSDTGAADVVQNAVLEPTGQLASVSGRLLGEDGPPVAGASVQLYSALHGRRFQAASDANGRFLMAGVEEADDYRLWVHPARGYRDHTRESLEVRAPSAAFDVTLESLGQASLRGSMVDPEGRPLPGFTLWVRPAYGATSPAAVTGDGQGVFASGELPEGPVAVETRAAPLLSVSGISLVAGPPREVVLTLDVGGYRLDGIVRADNGAPVGGARVALFWSRSDGALSSRSMRETVSDATGAFAFAQLGAGVHTLSATAAGFRSARVDQPVGPAMSPVEIRLAAGP